MTTHHYRKSDGRHVYSRNGVVAAVIERVDDHYMLRRVLASRELDPQRFLAFESAELAALRFADGLPDTAGCGASSQSALPQ